MDVDAGDTGRDTVVPDGSRRVVAAPLATTLRFDTRTRVLLEGPILSTLLRLATPNVVVMLAQACVGLVETSSSP
jgi:hypothetical protein